MKPRASMPTTRSTSTPAKWSAIASIEKRNASTSAQQRSDVFEDDAGLREVGHVADELLEPHRVDRHHSRLPPPPLASAARRAVQCSKALRDRAQRASSCAAEADDRAQPPVDAPVAAPAGNGARASLRRRSTRAARRRAGDREWRPRSRPGSSRATVVLPNFAFSARYRGSRSLSAARIGVAMKIDEYEPVMRPTSSARAKSSSAVAPIRIDPTKSSDMHGEHGAQRRVQRPSEHLVHAQVHDVAVGRATASRAPGGVLVHLVEHDDGVIEREAEDGEERDHGRRRDLEPEERVHANTDEDVVRHRGERGDGHAPLEPDRDVQGQHDEEDDERAYRLVGDLSTPRRADRREAHLADVDLRVGGECLAHAARRDAGLRPGLGRGCAHRLRRAGSGSFRR